MWKCEEEEKNKEIELAINDSRPNPGKWSEVRPVIVGKKGVRRAYLLDAWYSDEKEGGEVMRFDPHNKPLEPRHIEELSEHEKLFLAKDQKDRAVKAKERKAFKSKALRIARKKINKTA